jgi:phage portal protein BeeE
MAFTPYAKHYITDGVKSIPLNALPEEAWTTISGGNDRGGGGDAVELARLVPFLRRCIEVRANSVAAVPWTIYRGDEPVWDSDSDEAPDELKWLEDLPEYIYLMESALCLMATAYFEKSRNMAGNQRAISWLAPQTMTPKWDREQGLTHF